MFNRLSNGDPLKYDSISELNYILCLNQLMLWKYEAEVQEYQIQQQMKKR